MKAYHSLITGDSGGGKTSLMRELYHAPGWECRSVWVNHNDTVGLTGHGDRPAETVTSERELRSSGKRCVNYRCSDQLDGVGAAVRFARDSWDRQGIPCQIFVDEVHNIWPKKGEDTSHPLKWALHEGRDSAVVVRMASQDPSDLKPYTPLKQASFIAWCGEWNGFHEGFLNAHSWIDKGDLPTENYRYVVLDKRGNVIFEGRTKKRFS